MTFSLFRAGHPGRCCDVHVCTVLQYSGLGRAGRAGRASRASRATRVHILARLAHLARLALPARGLARPGCFFAPPRPSRPLGQRPSLQMLPRSVILERLSPFENDHQARGSRNLRKEEGGRKGGGRGEEGEGWTTVDRAAPSFHLLKRARLDDSAIRS